MFTDQSEYDLYNYRIKIKNQLLQNENKFSDLTIKIIKLMYGFQLSSSFHKVDLTKYFTEDDIKKLIVLWQYEFDKLYFSGSYYCQYETSYYGYPLVILKTSIIKQFQRHFDYHKNKIIGYCINTYYNDDKLIIIEILLTNMKNYFFGTDGEPTNYDQQIEILKKFLVHEF